MAGSTSLPVPPRRPTAGARHVWPLILRPKNTFRFLKDPAAPLLPKLGLIAAALYVIWPLDLIPDLVPFFTWLDDIGVATAAGAWLLAAVGRHARREEDAELEAQAASTAARTSS